MTIILSLPDLSPTPAGRLSEVTRLRVGSDPSIARPDPSARLAPMSGHANDAEKNVANVAHGGKGLVAKLSPRLGEQSEHVIRGTLLFLVPVYSVSNSYSSNRFHQSV